MTPEQMRKLAKNLRKQRGKAGELVTFQVLTALVNALTDTADEIEAERTQEAPK